MLSSYALDGTGRSDVRGHTEEAWMDSQRLPSRSYVSTVNATLEPRAMRRQLLQCLATYTLLKKVPSARRKSTYTCLGGRTRSMVKTCGLRNAASEQADAD